MWPLIVACPITARRTWVAQDQAFWLLNETFASTASFETSPIWGEGYVKPFVTFSTVTDGGVELYGAASIIGSITLGTDVFDQTDASEVLLEEAFAGLAVPLAQGGSIDLSLGAQLYENGTGMLLSAGSGNGFERGALIFGPRQAWEMTAFLGYSDPASTVQAFFLDPRELASKDTDTTLAGLTATQTWGDFTLGGTGGVVLTSDAPWVRAAPDGRGTPEIILGGRDGMRFLNLWAS